MIFQKMIESIKETDKKILKIVNYGVKISFLISVISCLILLTYKLIGFPEIYYIGMSLFKTSLFFIVGFIICGIAFNNILNEIM